VGRLAAAFAVTAVFMVVEIATGLATGSLALLSDGAHMVTDVLGVGLALAAIIAARRAQQQPGRTFGLYRAEVLAALANAVLLFGVAGYVLYEAFTRFEQPPNVPGLPVVVVSLLGLAANIFAFLLLKEGQSESLNLRGAYLEVVADMIGSIGVLISGLIILTTGWRYADPIIGVVIGLFVLPRTWTLAKRSLRILFQHAPERVNVNELTEALKDLQGVNEVHDVHVWTLTSGMEVASAHLTTTPKSNQETILKEARQLLSTTYNLEHATLQIESGKSAETCRELHW
jgi:cobalt-zinc-cadmium efflux system protein